MKIEKRLNKAFDKSSSNAPSATGGLWKIAQYIISGIAYIWGASTTQLIRLDVSIPTPPSPKNQLKGWYEYELNKYNREIERLNTYISKQTEKMEAEQTAGEIKQALKRADRISEAEYELSQQMAALAVIRKKLYKHAV